MRRVGRVFLTLSNSPFFKIFEKWFVLPAQAQIVVTWDWQLLATHHTEVVGIYVGMELIEPSGPNRWLKAHGHVFWDTLDCLARTEVNHAVMLGRGRTTNFFQYIPGAIGRCLKRELTDGTEAMSPK